MCDTMVALGSATKDGNTIFAKNSDRQPNEPLLMQRIPGQTHAEGAQVKCTYITIEQARETYDVLLLKPSWMWGAWAPMSWPQHRQRSGLYQDQTRPSSLLA